MNVDEGQLDRETAERMLDGAFATREADPVAELLLRAAAPGRPQELAREEDVVLAFRSARKHERRFWWRRLFTFKFFGAFVALITAGGLAYASSTGIIPAPFRATPPVAPATSGPEPVAPRPQSPTVASEDEQLHGLCNAYLAKRGDERGKALQTPVFARLVAAAGTADRVEAYCGVLAEKQKEKEKEKSKASPDPPRGPANTQSRRAQ